MFPRTGTEAGFQEPRPCTKSLCPNPKPRSPKPDTRVRERERERGAPTLSPPPKELRRKWDTELRKRHGPVLGRQASEQAKQAAQKDPKPETLSPNHPNPKTSQQTLNVSAVDPESSRPQAAKLESLNPTILDPSTLEIC